MGKKDRDNLLDWMEKEDAAVWRVRILEPAILQVSIEYHSEEGSGGGGGTFLIQAAGQTLRAEVRPTGEARRFQVFQDPKSRDTADR